MCPLDGAYPISRMPGPLKCPPLLASVHAWACAVDCEFQNATPAHNPIVVAERNTLDLVDRNADSFFLFSGNVLLMCWLVRN